MRLARAGPVEAARLEPWRASTGFSLRRRVWGAAWVVAIAGSLVLAGVGREETVNADGLPQLGNFFAAALHPRLDSDFLDLTWDASVVTLSYAVLGTALSLVIGLVGGAAIAEAMWRSSSGSGRRRSTAGWLLVRALLVVPRGIHEVVWGLLLLSVLGLDPMVAVLAIGIPYGAVTAKVFAEILDEAPRAPFAALTASGTRRPAALLYSLLPATLPDLASYSFYRFECAIRGAAILGLVGAGGLGFQLALSFQALRYEEMWTLLYALILLSGAADLWSTVVRMRARRARQGRDRVLAASVVGAALMVPLSAWQVDLDPLTVFAGRARDLFGDALAGAWPPDLGGGTLQLVAEASVDTMAMSVIAIAIAFTGGAALAFPAAAAARIRGSPLRKARAGVLALVSRSFLLFLRAVPPPVSAFLLLLVLFPGVLPGAVALGLYNLGILGRLMAEAVENFDDRALQALEAGGATPAQAFLYGTVPGLATRFLAYGLYRWEVAIRETVVVGVVGAGGLGVLLAERIAAFDYAGVTTVLAAVIVLTLVVDFLSAAMRGAFERG
ncbi:MAG: phosphonate transport system permease protein [Thermoleophilaceae bacterium]|jgi:phosphonate transport system permease protein|nr:phosphonate transport system permease protein [Thermoleophilaceae bacterium]